MTQQEKYSVAGREFLAKAQEALDQGDLAQASEKGWGAATQMVKAIAEQRGWPHQSHTALYQVVRQLVSETGDPLLDLLFHAAGNLHANFYENWLPAGSVQSGLEAMQEFLVKLEQLLEPPRTG